MSKPRIFAKCKAGCKWETVHRSEFVNVLPWADVDGGTSAEYELEIGRTYRAYDRYDDGKWSFEVIATYTYEDLSGNGLEGTKGTFDVKMTLPEFDKYRDHVEVVTLLADDFDFIPFKDGGGYDPNRFEDAFVYEVNGKRTIHHREFLVDFIDSSITNDFDVVGLKLNRIYVKSARKVQVKNDTGEISVNNNGASIEVDNYISDTSTNPVQNKVIKEYVDKAVGTGGGTGGSGVTDAEMSATSTNAVQNKVIKAYVDSLITVEENDDGTVNLVIASR